MSYFVFLGLLYCFLLLVVYFRALRSRPPTSCDPGEALDLSLIIMLAGFTGARFTHVIFENPEIYQAHPERIFQFWNGGYVFYGGALGAAIATTLYIRIRRWNFSQWADFFAPIFALGYGLGRISCFMAGCCYGKSCELPWAIGGRHPTQLYAVVWELILFIALIILPRRQKLRSGSLFLIWVFGHATGRLLMESLRDDFRGPAVMGLSFSSLISLLLLVTVLILKMRQHSSLSK